MGRKICIALAIAATGMFVQQANAQQPYHHDGSLSQGFHYDFYRNKNWPSPFRQMDASAVLSYMNVQRNKGWRLHNTLGTSMFDPETDQLTDSGRAHVRWIVARAPLNRRVVFVLKGDDQQTTAKRVESTQLAISRFIPVGPLPEIYLTDQDAPGSSGQYQTAILQAMTSTIPEPRLQDAGNLTGAGGGQ